MLFEQDRREDTLLKLAHFKRHKRKPLKKTGGKATSYPFHKPEENHPPGKDSTGKIPNLIGQAAKYAGSAKSKKVLFANCFHVPIAKSTSNKYHAKYNITC